MHMTQIDWKTENSQHFEQHALNRLLPVYPWLLQDFINAVGQPLVGLKILEIGSGPGFMLQQLAKCSPKLLIGIDKSAPMLQASLEKAKTSCVSLVQGDACSLPLTNGSIDALFSRGSIFFWQDIRAALQQIRRCLRPGGTALIGGGYGFSTPQEIIDNLKKSENHRDDKKIPRLNLDELVALACSIGGKAEIMHEKKRGFWLHWKV